MTHTPGPWHFGKYADRVTATEDSDGRDSICHVYGNQQANARLIAAAPEMLNALQQFISFQDADDNVVSGEQLEQLYNSAIKEARRLVAKHEGKTNETI